MSTSGHTYIHTGPIALPASLKCSVTRKTVFDRWSRSDRPRHCVTTPIRAGPLTLIYDLDFQSQASIGHDPHIQKTQFQRSVGSKDRVETNGQTDRQTDRRTMMIALRSRLTQSLITLHVRYHTKTFITGPPTHSAGDQTIDTCWCLSVVVVVVCDTPRRYN